MREMKRKRAERPAYVLPDEEPPTYVLPKEDTAPNQPHSGRRRGGEHYWQTGNMILTKTQFSFVFAKEVSPMDIDREYRKYLNDVWR
jgi:hypothetical protein